LLGSREQAAKTSRATPRILSFLKLVILRVTVEVQRSFTYRNISGYWRESVNAAFSTIRPHKRAKRVQRKEAGTSTVRLPQDDLPITGADGRLLNCGTRPSSTSNKNQTSESQQIRSEKSGGGWLSQGDRQEFLRGAYWDRRIDRQAGNGFAVDRYII